MTIYPYGGKKKIQVTDTDERGVRSGIRSTDMQMITKEYYE